MGLRQSSPSGTHCDARAMGASSHLFGKYGASAPRFATQVLATLSLSSPTPATGRGKENCLAVEIAGRSAWRERSVTQSSPPARAGRNSSARAVPNGALITLREAPRPGRHGSSAAADGVRRSDAHWARIADPRSASPEAGPSRPVAIIVAETTGKAEVGKGREM